MSEQHTPEPWATKYRKKSDGNYSQQIYDQKGDAIADVAWYPIRVSETTTETNREQNARRIVACVNACKGIPTADLEAKPGAVLEIGTTALRSLVDELEEILNEDVTAYECMENALARIREYRKQCGGEL